MHASVAEVSHVRRPEKRLRESGEVEHVRSGGLVFQKIRDAPEPVAATAPVWSPLTFCAVSRMPAMASLSVRTVSNTGYG